MTSTESPSFDPVLYQEQRPLSAVPAYGVGLQLKLSGGESVYVALSGTELALYFHHETALHFDLEARLVKVAEPNRYWRRSFSHRIVYTRKRTAEEGGGIERAVLTEEEADRVVDQAHTAVQTVWHELRDGVATVQSAKPDVPTASARLATLLERAARFDVRAARQDAARFQSIYRSVAVLPPNEYNAVVLQATEGCRYNHCTFCRLYEGVRFRAKPPDEFARHIADVLAYHGETLRSRRSLFLGEANALTLSQRELVADLQMLRLHFELPTPEQGTPGASWWLGQPRRFDGVASFLDVFTSPIRSGAEWSELFRLGLRRVHIGLESGSEPLLRWLKKPITPAEVLQTVTLLKEAGLTVAVIVLLGAGGHRFAEAHVRDTVRLLNALPLQRGDYIYLSPLIIYPGGPYEVTALHDGVRPLTPVELDEQERQIRAQLHWTRRAPPHVARYELETFTY
ncbi:MAG: radical SAM protein [Verrucomicrobiae bacterium]|nr:radical SAM protein [Verrucomicrobiae bacterium]